MSEVERCSPLPSRGVGAYLQVTPPSEKVTPQNTEQDTCRRPSGGNTRRHPSSCTFELVYCLVGELYLSKAMLNMQCLHRAGIFL